MANDIEKAVDMLKQMLGDDDAKENLQNIAQQVLGSADKEEKEEISLPAELENLDIAALINKASAPDDDRIILLKALKPYLSSKRREKTDSAISIMRFVNISSSLGLMDMLK